MNTTEVSIFMFSQFTQFILFPICRYSESSRSSYLSVAQLTRDTLPSSHEYLRATLPSAHTIHQFMSQRSVANFPDAREVLAAKAEPMPENQTTYEQATFIETTTPEPASVNRWEPLFFNSFILDFAMMCLWEDVPNVYVSKHCKALLVKVLSHWEKSATHGLNAGYSLMTALRIDHRPFSIPVAACRT